MSSTRDTILRNTFWYGVVTALGLAAGLVMSIVLARGLGPARMGEYSYLLWLLRTVTAVATLGFAVATTRYTAAALGRDDARGAGAYLRFFVRAQLGATTAVAVLALPLVVWLAPAGLRWPLIVLLVGLFPTTLEAIYSHAAHGAQRYDLTAQASTLKMVLQLTAAVAAMAAGADILGLFAGITLATVASCALQRRRALALYPDRAGGVPGEARGELRAYLVPLSVVVALDALVWDRSEVFFLRLYGSSEDIAFYSLAFGLATRGMVVASVCAGALLPALATLHGRGAHAEFAGVYRAALRGVAMVGAPLAAVGAALAPTLVSLLYGPAYQPVAALLGPMLVVAVVGVMRTVAQAALRAGGDRRWALHATLLSAAVNVAAAAILIPSHGVWGALAANAGAQGLAATITFAGVARREHAGLPLLDLARIGGAAALAAVATSAVSGPDGGLVAVMRAAAVGGLVFVLAAALLGALGRREARMARDLAARVPPRAQAAGTGLVTAAALVALYAPVARDLVGVWASERYYSYGFLVPVFSAWLLWDARARLWPLRPAWSATGAALVGGGLALLALAAADGSLSLRALSLPLVLGGLARLALGPERARAAAFAVGFLAFMAPLPDGVLPAVSEPLQRLAAWFTTGVLLAAGIPALREGLLVRIPGVELHVTEACNGLRFLLAMIVLGTAFAWTTQTRAARRALVLALAVVVAIAANLVRVAGTGLIAHYWGPEAVMGFAHVTYGKLVYLAMLVPFIGGVLLLRRAAPVAPARDA